MWINSPLGKWEQEARVNKALQDAERLRAQEAGNDADGAAWSGGLLITASARLDWLAARTRVAVQSIQMRLAPPVSQQD
jgi:hypothetical protein